MALVSVQSTVTAWLRASRLMSSPAAYCVCSMAWMDVTWEPAVSALPLESVTMALVPVTNTTVWFRIYTSNLAASVV